MFKLWQNFICFIVICNSIFSIPSNVTQENSALEKQHYYYLVISDVVTKLGKGLMI